MATPQMAPRSASPTRLRDRVLVTGFMVMLALPAILLFSGMQPGNYLNRALATFPALSGKGVSDGTYFSAVDAYLDDNLPVRPAVIEAKAEFDYQVLGVSSNPSVVVGRDGWLFFDQEVAPTCNKDAATVLQQMDGFAATVGTASRSFYFTIAPDKRTIYPEQLPASLQGVETCTDHERPAMRSGMARRPQTTIDLWGPVDAARESSGSTPIYWPKDTHWNTIAAIAAVRTIVQSIDAAAWSESDVVSLAESQPHGDDLMHLMGIADSVVMPAVTVSRPGQQIQAVPPSGPVGFGEATQRFVSEGTAPVIPGRTLIVGDSFFDVALPLLAPWFQDLTFVSPARITCPEVLDQLTDYETIIVEQVERDAYRVDYQTILAPLFARLTGQPAPVTPAAYLASCAPQSGPSAPPGGPTAPPSGQNTGQGGQNLTTVAPGFVGSADVSAGGTTSGAQCNADTLNGVAFDQVGSSPVQSINIAGWAADLQTKTAPSTTYLQLVGPNGDRYYVATQVYERPDVAKAYDAPALTESGFVAQFSAENLAPGEYAVRVVMDTPRGPLVCNTRHTLQLTAG